MTQELCQVAADGARTCMQLSDSVLFMGPTLTGGTTQEGFVLVLSCYLVGFGTGMLKRVLQM